jgi:hypothetical protein
MRIDCPILILASAMALAGCNRQTQSATLASPAPCVCTQQPASIQQPAETGPPIQIHHGHHLARTSRGEDAESSAYDYADEGHVYGPEDEIRENDDTAVRDRGSPQSAPVWTDAYGRQHFADRDDDQRKITANDRARLDPWHGYDAHDGLENGY